MQSFSIRLQTKVNSVKGDQAFIFKWVEQNYWKGLRDMAHLDFFDTYLLLFKTFKQLRWFGSHRNWWYFCFWRLSITIGLFLSSIISRTGLNTWIRSCHSALIVIQSEILNEAILLKPEKSQQRTHRHAFVFFWLCCRYHPRYLWYQGLISQRFHSNENYQITSITQYSKIIVNSG